VAFEAAGDHVRAAQLYDVVSRVDPSFTSAAFGLARCLAAAHDIDGAVRAYGRLPSTSRVWLTGRVAAVRTLLASLQEQQSWSADRPNTAKINERLQLAASIIRVEPLDPELRAQLARDVYDTALARLEADHLAPHKGVDLLDRPLTADGMRAGLEATYRELARFAPTAGDRVQLIDLANFFRPTTIR
jgi:serine/threonine-protein kinase PknG